VTEETCVISAGNLNFTIDHIPTRVGDKVEVLGRLGENYRIAVEKVLVYERMSYFMEFCRSLVGAALLAFFFLMYWKFKIKKFKFVGRK